MVTKNLIKFVVVFLFLSLILAKPSKGVICCQTALGEQKRCWGTGVCCNKGTELEYWSPNSCYNFTMWTSVSQVFRVGQKTHIALYLQNTGGYVDSYDIDYELLDCENPSLVILDTSGISPITNVYPNEKRVVYPRITILATNVYGVINFTGISQGDNTIQRSATLTILQSDYPVSLPEFENQLILLILISSSIVIIFHSKNYYFRK